MTLNLLADPWLPVIKSSEIVKIRPDEIADPGTTRLAWPRPDFNLACLELLIGLVSMAYPPKDDADWEKKLENPDTDQLRDRFEEFAGYFYLGGSGPRFLQDIEPFEYDINPSQIKPVDMIFIDSPGDATVKKNSDLMVKRDRFLSLMPAEAAMALYTLQAFAPVGGSGNRTSMRGGGPMTTLVQPLELENTKNPLWRLVYSNVLPGTPLPPHDAHQALPWIRETITSEKNQVVTEESSHSLEAFFGMPRRLRLIFDSDKITGVVQKKYGTNYSSWKHPLTPYYRQKEGDLEWLPVHPKAGPLSYRNWLGTTVATKDDGTGTTEVAKAVSTYGRRSGVPDYELLVGGWAMDNMKPVDFTLNSYPKFPRLNEGFEDRVRLMVDAANATSNAIRKALRLAGSLDGKSLDSVIEEFFTITEEEFVSSVREIAGGKGTEIEEGWYNGLRDVAIPMFDERTLTGLIDHSIADIEKRTKARRNLDGELAIKVRKILELPIPTKKEKRK